MAQITTSRQERGQTIANQTGQIQRIDEIFYIVKSQSGNGEYTVNKVNGEWICDCPDHKYRHVTCKHIHAVIFSQAVRAEVKVRKPTTTITPITSLTNCIYCGSDKLIKKGLRKNKTGDIQKYQCQTCNRYFTFNIGFERMKHNPQAVTAAMQLYFSGESLRSTMRSLRLLGVEVSYRTILNWIRKYTKLMQQYTEQLTPNVSNKWRADEIYMKIKGDMKYLFAMMDDETRFWIAQEVADTKDRHDSTALFTKASYLMGKKPETLVTDGLGGYKYASMAVYPKTNHERKITLKGKVHNNNKMERLNGEIRDREKTMRGLKTKETAILKGCQLYHNYIRPHEGLDGKTPAEACGIKVEGENKWLTLIQNACNEVNR